MGSDARGPLGRGGSGLVQPNAIALAMAPHGRQAGSASALLGAFQMAIAAALGALIGLLHNGTALPMVGVIATCVTAAFLILQWVTRRESFRASPI